MLLMLSFAACRRETPVPRPMGYFRIDLPEKNYLPFDTTYPFAFEYSSASRLVPRGDNDSTKYWLNITYPDFKGTLHLSYKEVHDNIHILLDDAIDLANRHIPKATAMEPTLILRDSAKVYGLIYDISGSGVASTIQFYLTDSVNHYVRGALYFYVIPNNDSLSPVIDYIHEDVNHLIESFRWK
jgi:gliding motility-associated lipoprotein GldD